MNKSLMAQLLVVFIATQALGLFAGSYLIQNDYRAVIVNENPDSLENSIGLIAWILASTAVMLLMIKFAPEWLFTFLIKILEALATIGTAIIVMLPLPITAEEALAIALLLAVTRIAMPGQLVLRNITGIVAAAGAGALIGASLGAIPVAVFLALLCAYDFIAVFKTKHMVTLAKAITKKNISFTIAMPTKEHQFELGTGDLVVPLAFAVSILGAERHLPMPYAMVPSIAVLAASLVGLMATLHYASLHKGTALPALPAQGILMLATFGITKLAGF
ncbi:MAG: hypothetical protein HY544_05610 [Candidatus Diapherotrites archaeon]|uniref:Signal-peptide peptidase, presenilin aspartyl protease n=1 Tax=Candidatus Iainarchaeum sp. TaxID=3101447 RepID=A0A8T3YPM2_9ARCH|nr:hypothetical protein [Candidatus Diapherotrites archaeon]